MNTCYITISQKGIIPIELAISLTSLNISLSGRAIDENK